MQGSGETEQPIGPTMPDGNQYGGIVGISYGDAWQSFKVPYGKLYVVLLNDKAETQTYFIDNKTDGFHSLGYLFNELRWT